MRVLFWTPLYPPSIGGLEILVADLARGLRARGHDVCVVTGVGPPYGLPEHDVHEGTPVHRIGFREALERRDPAGVIAARRRIADLKRSFRPDVVHSHLPDVGVLGHLRTLDAHPARLVVTAHMVFEDELYLPRPAFDTLMDRAAWVTAVSEASLAPLLAGWPGIADRSSVVHCGREAPTLPLAAPPAASRPVVLCMGRLVRDKGFDVAIAAFARIADAFPRARLVVGGDGPERSRLEEQAAALGIADRATFTGWVSPDATTELIDGATVVVMPSRWEEAFGLVALEAAQRARPVVAARVGGVPELVDDGETGLLFGREDAEGCAAAIAALLAEPGRARRMGEAGRERARVRFGLDRFVDGYEDLYHHITREAVHGGAR